jgi:hypothetical protein
MLAGRRKGPIMSEPPPEEPYELPGTTAAYEPSTLPNRPLTAADAAPFVPKIIS